ncbi:MAG TPA: amidohydrolase family protein [Vicinamibacterales bacterium]|nr:amidohydrolase family protein [Vicinamibacterales bacterium]
MPIRVAVILLSGAFIAQAPAPRAELILHGGNVITVDAQFRTAQAVAVGDGRIIAVGSDADVKRLAAPNTRLVDLDGRTVVPGLMDNHLHGAGGGPGVDLSRARSLADVLDAVAARVRETPAGGIVLSNSDWHEAQLQEQRLPLRDDLDRVAPAHPVVLVRGGHEYILNSAALAKWHVDEGTSAPEGGRITRYADGRLNGELVDRAKGLVSLPRPEARTLEQRMQDRIADYRKLHAVGLTTVRHPGVSVEEYRMLQEMRRRGLLTMRVRVLLRPPARTADEMIQALAASGVRPDEGDEWLKVVGIKLAVDGGFEGGLMREPYDEPFGEGGLFHGLRTVEPANFIATVRALNRAGWRVATHAVGDAGIDLVLQAYEVAHADRPIAGRGWTIEHAFIGREDHLRRLKALDVAISAQDHLYLAGPSLVKYWGRERAHLTTPVRRYLDAGLLVSSGTDAPVVPYPPLWTLYHFISRDTLTGGVMGHDQRISREDGLRLATINNARLMFDAASHGTIEPGKAADLAVLSEDPLTAPAERIRDARVLMTIVDGRLVYEDAAQSSASSQAPLPGTRLSLEELRTQMFHVSAGRRLRPASWPLGARVAVSLSFDVDNATASLSQGVLDYEVLSRGEYGAVDGLPRILRLLDKHKIPASFFIPAVAAALHPRMIEDIQAHDWHEIGVHGWIHERLPLLNDAREEQRLLTQSIELLTKMTGRRPVGYRAPSWQFSYWTPQQIKDAGFLYDSSLMASDDAYELLLDGKPTGVIELPIERILDDFPYFGGGANGSNPSPQAVFDVFQSEFDVAYEEGGLYLLTMHPHIMGHRSRVALLDRLIQYMKSKPGVWFATHERIAQHVRPLLNRPAQGR